MTNQYTIGLDYGTNSIRALIVDDETLARALGGQLAVMLEGRMVERGEAEAVLAAPQHTYTRRLLAADPDFATWSPADQELMVRFAETVLGSVTEAETAMMRAEHAAKEAGAKAG